MSTVGLDLAVGPRAGASRLVETLERAKHRFLHADRVAKRRALATLAERPIRRAALLLRLHEALCFMRAHPDDAGLLGAVETALAGFGRRVAALPSREARVLEESGVAGTTVYCPLSYAVARWLAQRFPDAVEIDWEDAESEEGVAALLPLAVEGLQEEALVDVGVPYRAWLSATKGRVPGSDLAWLLDRLEHRPRGREAARALYDRIQPRLRWALRASRASRTLARVPPGRVFFQRRALTSRGGSLSRRLPGPPMPVAAASRREGAALRDLALAAVTARYREVHGFTFANVRDVVVAEAGRGVRIAWFGLLAAHRLPLRAHYGYLILKNGVPVGYGDASLLFDWCEIAYNIFETFRQGESAFIFERLLGFVCQAFGARTFHLSPYQLGQGNEEALTSGAFWFYYKLGFRPTRRDLARLMAAERRRIRRNRAHRSSRETLARLGGGRMSLAVGGLAASAVRDFEVGQVGRRARAAASAAAVAPLLGGPRWRAWRPPERLALGRLAPVLAVIPDLARWPSRDRRALIAVIRAKGGPHEAEYLRRLRAHPRLRASILRLGRLGRPGR